MRIALGSDHAGYRYKQLVAERLRALGHDVVDFGTNSDESVDYPLFIRPACEAVANGDCERAIIFGGSGNGEAMVANRITGVRAAVVWSTESARFARLHNDANVMSIGQRLVDEALLPELLDIFLDTEFEAGRHVRRIQQIDE
ncbi:MAG: RpiB/LacA/LacB family sugar-phosphate isomerase [Chloroflexota bacterium]